MFLLHLLLTIGKVFLCLCSLGGGHTATTFDVLKIGLAGLNTSSPTHPLQPPSQASFAHKLHTTRTLVYF